MPRHWIACLYLALIPFIACANHDAVKSEVARTADSALIFIPGYYGSTLNDVQTGKQFFITANQYFFGSNTVSLHTEDLETPPAPKLVAGEILGDVPIFFGLVKIDVYGEIIKELRQIEAARSGLFVPMPYDWRDDLMNSVRQLSNLVKEQKAKGITHVRIVAHSMGCLITQYYLAYGDQDPERAELNWQGAREVDRVVLMAGPYRGAFSLFRNMQTGAKIGSNRSYMPSETVASLPASYQLLPFANFHLLDRLGHMHTFDLADVNEWEQRKLGLLRRQDLAPTILSRRKNFVTEQLLSAQKFTARLWLDENVKPHFPDNVKVLQLVGEGHPTIDTAFYEPRTKALQFDAETTGNKVENDHLLYKDGDGSVTTFSAQLPGALKAATIVLRSQKVHDKIFEDESFRAKLKSFLQ